MGKFKGMGSQVIDGYLNSGNIDLATVAEPHEITTEDCKVRGVVINVTPDADFWLAAAGVPLVKIPSGIDAGRVMPLMDMEFLGGLTVVPDGYEPSPASPLPAATGEILVIYNPY